MIPYRGDSHTPVLLAMDTERLSAEEAIAHPLQLPSTSPHNT